MFARLFSMPAPSRPAHARKRTFVVALVAAVSALLMFAAAPAGALVTSIGGMTVGVSPRVNEDYLEHREPKQYANPSGNPVLHGAGDYAIYWDPTDHYWSEWQARIDTYLEQVGAESGSLESVFAVESQYTDKSNHPAA